MEVTEIRVKTILVPSKLPEADLVINGYVGCRFGCTYCYASFMGRFVDKSVADWGQYVAVKINAPELLKKELSRLKNKGQGLVVLLSSVTDPFQGLEAKYHISQRCLEVLADWGFAGRVSILTKSPLVLSVLPTLRLLKDVEVGLTITSTDDKISRYFEKYAPMVSQRIETLKKLNGAGFKTYAFFGPLLPHFVAHRQGVRKVLDAIYATGTRRLFIEHLNLSPHSRRRLTEELKGTSRQVLEKFYSSQAKDYRRQLNSIIGSLLKGYDFELLHGSVLFHPEDKSWQKAQSGQGK